MSDLNGKKQNSDRIKEPAPTKIKHLEPKNLSTAGESNDKTAPKPRTAKGISNEDAIESQLPEQEAKIANKKNTPNRPSRNSGRKSRIQTAAQHNGSGQNSKENNSKNSTKQPKIEVSALLKSNRIKKGTKKDLNLKSGEKNKTMAKAKKANITTNNQKQEKISQEKNKFNKVVPFGARDTSKPKQNNKPKTNHASKQISVENAANSKAKSINSESSNSIDHAHSTDKTQKVTSLIRIESILIKSKPVNKTTTRAKPKNSSVKELENSDNIKSSFKNAAPKISNKPENVKSALLKENSQHKPLSLINASMIVSKQSINRAKNQPGLMQDRRKDLKSVLNPNPGFFDGNHTSPIKKSLSDIHEFFAKNGDNLLLPNTGELHIPAEIFEMNLLFGVLVRDAKKEYPGDLDTLSSPKYKDLYFLNYGNKWITKWLKALVLGLNVQKICLAEYKNCSSSLENAISLCNKAWKYGTYFIVEIFRKYIKALKLSYQNDHNSPPMLRCSPLPQLTVPQITTQSLPEDSLYSSTPSELSSSVAKRSTFSAFEWLDRTFGNFIDISVTNFMTLISFALVDLKNDNDKNSELSKSDIKKARLVFILKGSEAIGNLYRYKTLYLGNVTSQLSMKGPVGTTIEEFSNYVEYDTKLRLYYIRRSFFWYCFSVTLSPSNGKLYNNLAALFLQSQSIARFTWYSLFSVSVKSPFVISREKLLSHLEMAKDSAMIFFGSPGTWRTFTKHTEYTYTSIKSGNKNSSTSSSKKNCNPSKPIELVFENANPDLFEFLKALREIFSSQVDKPYQKTECSYTDSCPKTSSIPLCSNLAQNRNKEIANLLRRILLSSWLRVHHILFTRACIDQFELWVKFVYQPLLETYLQFSTIFKPGISSSKQTGELGKQLLTEGLLQSVDLLALVDIETQSEVFNIDSLSADGVGVAISDLTALNFYGKAFEEGQSVPFESRCAASLIKSNMETILEHWIKNAEDSMRLTYSTSKDGSRLKAKPQIKHLCIQTNSFSLDYAITIFLYLVYPLKKAKSAELGSEHCDIFANKAELCGPSDPHSILLQELLNFSFRETFAKFLNLAFLEYKAKKADIPSPTDIDWEFGQISDTLYSNIKWFDLPYRSSMLNDNSDLLDKFKSMYFIGVKTADLDFGSLETAESPKTNRLMGLSSLVFENQLIYVAQDKETNQFFAPRNTKNTDSPDQLTSTLDSSLAEKKTPVRLKNNSRLLNLPKDAASTSVITERVSSNHLSEFLEPVDEAKARDVGLLRRQVYELRQQLNEHYRKSRKIGNHGKGKHLKNTEPRNKGNPSSRQKGYLSKEIDENTSVTTGTGKDTENEFTTLTTSTPGTTCFVFDTNCYIESLVKVTSFVSMELYDTFVPLPVIMELDGLKNAGQKLGQMASKTMAFIEERLKSPLLLDDLGYSKTQKIDALSSQSITDVSNRTSTKPTCKGKLRIVTKEGEIIYRVNFGNVYYDEVENGYDQSTPFRSIDDLIIESCTNVLKRGSNKHEASHAGYIGGSQGKSAGKSIYPNSNIYHKYSKVVLVTGDRNMRIKAMICGIDTVSFDVFNKWAAKRMVPSSFK